MTETDFEKCPFQKYHSDFTAGDKEGSESPCQWWLRGLRAAVGDDEEGEEEDDDDDDDADDDGVGFLEGSVSPVYGGC